MSRIILHIGTHKTATTTIQRSLSMQKDLLASTGILYPDYSLIGKPPHSSHVKITNALLGHNEYFSVSEAQLFFSEVIRQSHYFDATIISAECMYRHVLSDGKPRYLSSHDAPSYWHARRQYINFIAKIFDGLNISVCIVFRRQKDYAESLYQELVKVTRYSKNFETFIVEEWPHFAYRAQVECWRSHFNDLRISRFDDLVQSENLMVAFGDLIGCDLSALKTVGHHNVSLGVDATILKRQLNTTDTDHQKSLRSIQRFLAKLPPAAHRELKGRSFFSSATAAALFQSQFDHDNAALGPLIHDLDEVPAELFPSHIETPLCYGDEVGPFFVQWLLRISNDGVFRRTQRIISKSRWILKKKVYRFFYNFQLHVTPIGHGLRAALYVPSLFCWYKAGVQDRSGSDMKK